MKNNYNTIKHVIVNEYGNDITSLNSIQVDTTQKSSTYYKSIASKISEKYLKSEKVAVFSLITGKSTKFLIKALGDYDVDFHKLFYVILNYDYFDYDDGFLYNYSGVLFTVPYSPDQTSSLAQSFCSDAKKNIGINSICFYQMEFLYAGINVWKNSMTVSAVDSGENIPPIEYVRLNMINQEINSGSGSVMIDESLNSQRSMYVFEVNNNGENLQVYPLQGEETSIEPKPYVTGLPDSCKYGKSDEKFEYSESIIVLCYVFMGFAVLSCIYALVFTIIKRKKAIIRSFGRSYSYSLSILLLLSCFSLFSFTIPPSENNGICKFRVILLGFSFKGIIAIFYAKCVKIYIKYTRLRKPIIKTKISICRILFYLLSFLILEAILIVIWFLTDPPKYEEIYSQKYSSYFIDMYLRQCTISMIPEIFEFIIDGLLLFGLLVMCVKVKNAAPQFNEGFSMFVTVIILITFEVVIILLDFLITEAPDSTLLMRMMGIELMIIVIVIMQYAFAIFLDSDGNISTQSGSKNIQNSKAPSCSTSMTSSKLPNSSFLSQSLALTKTHNQFTTKTLTHK